MITRHIIIDGLLMVSHRSRPQGFKYGCYVASFSLTHMLTVSFGIWLYPTGCSVTNADTSALKSVQNSLQSQQVHRTGAVKIYWWVVSLPISVSVNIFQTLTTYFVSKANQKHDVREAERFCESHRWVSR